MESASNARPVRLAVAGSGAMARYHVRRFSAFDNVTVVGCYDRNADRASALANEYGIEHAVDSMAELFERVAPEAISIASADAEQAEIATAAIEHRIPVFAEKPFGTSVAEASSLAKLRRARGSKLLVNYSKLNFPAVWGLLHLVGSGRLGELQSIELSYLQSWLGSTIWGRWWEEPRWLWRISSSHGGGGALRDLGSHLLFLLLRLGRKPTLRSGSAEVTTDRNAADGSGYSCDLNDTFTAKYSLAGGGRARVHGSYAAPGHINYLFAKVIGEHGAAELHAEDDKSTLLVSGPRSAALRPVRFAKVYSTYNAFVRELIGPPLTASPAGTIARPSAKDAAAVHRLIEEL